MCLGALRDAAAHAQTSNANGLFYLSRAQKAYDSGDYTAALSALDEAFQAGLVERAVRARNPAPRPGS